MAIEPLAAYDGQAICDDTPKPGTDKFVALIKATYPDFAGDVWPPRDCAEGGRSEHKEYRAIDWMIDVHKPQQRAVAQSFLRWLLATDAQGNQYAMARRLGVMYIGWNDRIWQSSPGTPTWSEISWLHCFSHPEPDYDTSCHRNHIHISLSWDGAAGLTSFWGGSPTPLPYCPAADTTARPMVTVKGLDFVNVRPTRVYDGTTPIAPATAESSCRLSQAGEPALDDTLHAVAPGSTGDPIYVPVTGVGPTDVTTVRAVAVRITAEQPNAPLRLYAWPSGGTAPSTPVLTATPGESTAVETVLPIGSDGTIALGVDAGQTPVAVDVLGYFVRRPTDAVRLSGPLHSVTPALAYTTRGAERGALKPGETRTILLAGRAGLPAVDSATPMSSVWLSVTTSGARTTGTLAVARPHSGAGPAVSRVPVRRLQTVTDAVLTGVDEKGRITLTNSGRTAVNVDVTATGWAQRGANSGDLLLPIDPVVTLDTASGVGVRAAVAGSAGMKVLGVGRIPGKDVAGVIAQVTLTSGTVGASVALWPGASAPATSDPTVQPVVQQTLSSGPGETRTGLVLLPLSDAGGLRWAATQPDARVVVRIVGVLRAVPIAAVAGVTAPLS